MAKTVFLQSTFYIRKHKIIMKVIMHPGLRHNQDIQIAIHN